MNDITVNNLIKSFEIGENVLDGLSFTILEGEHVGILGVNGSGKTTLFKILTGEYDYDEGSVSIAPGKRLGLISQIPVYPDGFTVEDVLRSSRKRLDAIERRMAEIEADFTEDLMDEYSRLQLEFDSLSGYESESSISKVAAGLDIDENMRKMPFSLLSGGEQTRVNLARLILEDTDILLLDEPTNHLDLNAVKWLEDYIGHFRGTVLAVSHDRFFLDKVASRCIEIVDGKAEFYSGNYSFFVEERQRRFETKMKQYEKSQAKIDQLTRAAEQMHLWAFMGMDKLHKRAFSMEKRIEKLKTFEKPAEAKKMSVKFKQSDFSGDEVIAVSGLSKSYGEKKLFSDLNLDIIGCESIAVIGDNGTGKSTFIKTLTGIEQADEGLIYIGPQVRIAYLPQIVSFEDEKRSVYDTMLYECNCLPQQARDRLASFGFRGESVMTPVGALSGGERSRLKLCQFMGSEINLLILDEPTNHLDIASREWIESALSDYEQTLIFVSHDRYFIDRFATRVLSFDGNGSVTDYRGTYKEFCEYRSRLSAYEKLEEKVSSKKPSSQIESKKPVASCKRRSDKLEKEIEKLESKIRELDEQAALFSTDYVKLMEIDSEKNSYTSTLDELYTQWEELNS